MDNKIEVIEDALIVFGVVMSIDMIKTILGIILMSVQVVLILYKGIRQIYLHAKNKKYDEIVNTLDDMTNEIRNVIDENKDGKSDDTK